LLTSTPFFKSFLSVEIVAYKSRMEARKLPLVKNRTKAEGKVVGKAAQAFNVPNGAKEGYAGYIMGNLTLPPKGIKDAESVGSCSQTFTVVTGQPGALEIAYADPDEDENGNLSPETALRYLLGPGDMFRVPPGNCYRLQNHSKTENCFLTWTIIRPVTLDHHHQGGGSPTSSPATSMGGQSSK
jgi:centromere protein C